MKTLFVVPVIAVLLAGCAAPGPYYAAQPADPYQWRTVSVTPVPLGTGARAPAGGDYTSRPVTTTTYVQQPVYVPQPVYTPAPVYAPSPVYAAPPAYYWPPISIGLDFMFSNHHRHGWGGRGWGRGRR
ncbi:hypothetical protein [Pseudoduganella chitinolytica]|uniref:Lipoprotein n=1 Tax=Pseudoduganella chitinolytica TaxID=34070 RepID=A0ABY8B6S1_9BURK|nr:hypothetical protein [Pseudoduganella chitinolytica]WEF30708.1 hypothetical protein PX653_14615 [Pseudoduganella chitinolytica]